MMTVATQLPHEKPEYGSPYFLKILLTEAFFPFKTVFSD